MAPTFFLAGDTTMRATFAALLLAAASLAPEPSRFVQPSPPRMRGRVDLRLGQPNEARGPYLFQHVAVGAVAMPSGEWRATRIVVDSSGRVISEDTLPIPAVGTGQLVLTVVGPGSVGGSRYVVYLP